MRRFRPTLEPMDVVIISEALKHWHLTVGPGKIRPAYIWWLRDLFDKMRDKCHS